MAFLGKVVSDDTVAPPAAGADSSSSDSDENAPALALATAIATSPRRRSPRRPTTEPRSSASLGPTAPASAESNDAPNILTNDNDMEDDDDVDGGGSDDDDEENNGGSSSGGAISFTRVDGRGLWRSWKRNFKNKMLALLDLIDNSLDASIVLEEGEKSNGTGESANAEGDADFIGRVHIYPDDVGKNGRSRGSNGRAAANKSRHFDEEIPDRPNSAPEMVFSGVVSGSLDDDLEEVSNNDDKGLCILNNCVRPIRPLVKVLEVYNSSKIHSGAGDIGENGVGLKQGCATLSDLSFVMAKNEKDGFVELGMIAESLQRVEGCYLPAFRFTISQEDDNVETLKSLKDQMATLFSKRKHRSVAKCIEQYGSAMGGTATDMEKGLNRLLKHFDSVLNFFDNQYVFAVILTNISYGNPKDRKAADPIKDLQTEIPRTYLHIPPSFDFRIGRSRASREKLVFHYWPQRLVELSSFTVMINQNVPWHGSNPHEGAYKLRVFLGFDRFRIHMAGETSASLYVYSRESGRMVKYEPDARFILGLNASGSFYTQGLTVLIDDIGGNLPLNPTKQDVAFGEQENGEVHKDNLYTWVGSVTKFFYDYHINKFDKKKTILTKKIKEFGKDLVQTPLKEIDRSHVTTFNAEFRHYGKKSIRIELRTAKENHGPDTHFCLISDPSPSARLAEEAIEAAVKKRKFAETQQETARAVEAARVMGNNNLMRQTQNVQQVVATANAVVPRAPSYPPPQVNHVHNHTQQYHSQQYDRPHNAFNQQVQTQQYRAQNIQQQVHNHVQQVVQQHQQGIQTPSPQASSRVARSVTQSTRKSPRRSQSGRKAASNKASEALPSPVTSTIRSNVKAEEAISNGRDKAENGGAEDEVINLADDSDSESVASTKECYKKLCGQLTVKFEKKKKDLDKKKEENRRLKEEIAELKKEVDRLKGESSMVN